jgi:hypothetical protein
VCGEKRSKGDGIIRVIGGGGVDEVMLKWEVEGFDRGWDLEE